MRAITQPSPFRSGSSAAVNDFWADRLLLLPAQFIELPAAFVLFAMGLMVCEWSQYARIRHRRRNQYATQSLFAFHSTTAPSVSNRISLNSFAAGSSNLIYHAA